MLPSGQDVPFAFMSSTVAVAAYIRSTGDQASHYYGLGRGSWGPPLTEVLLAVDRSLWGAPAGRLFTHVYKQL